MAYDPTSGVFSMPTNLLPSDGDDMQASDVTGPVAELTEAQNYERPIVAGGTGAGTASQARANLGLTIGTDVQAYNANLQSLSGITLAADTGIYGTGAATFATFTITAAGRALVDDADAAAQRTTLGVAYASQAQAEAGTASTVVMTPQRTQQHYDATTPLVAAVSFAGGTGTIVDSKNVSSVTRNSAGRYTITFSSALSSSDYVVVGTTGDTSALTQWAAPVFVETRGTSTLVVYVGTHSPSSAATYVDMDYVSLAIFLF